MLGYKTNINKFKKFSILSSIFSDGVKYKEKKNEENDVCVKTKHATELSIGQTKCLETNENTTYQILGDATKAVPV